MVFSEAPGLADGYAGTIPADSGKNNQKVGYIIAIHRVRFDISTGGAGFHNPDREEYVDTALWVLVKSALLRLLPLDPALVRNHADELNLRLVRAGRADLAAPKITSWYSRRPSLSALFRRTASGRELGSERQC